MNHRRFHLLEKVQVQLAAAGAALVVYFAIWPALRPTDPWSPLTFIPTGSYAGVFFFAGIIWILSAICAVVTVSARPEGAFVAALIGAVGASARSAPIRSLLMLREDSLPALYLALILEVLVLFVVLLMAAVVVDLVRRTVASIKPGWLWKPPLAGSPEEEPRRSGAGGHDYAAPELCASMRRELVLHVLCPWFGAKGRGETAGRLAKRQALRQSVCCLGLGLVVAIVLLMLLMQSPDRGQILFSLIAAFLVASTVAHQVFPTPYSIVVWGMPMLVAIGLYALTAFSIAYEGASWIALPNYARALPTDWLTAGCGGALVGYWISERISELRHIERAESQKAQ